MYDSVLRFLEKSPDDVRPEGVRLYLYRIVHNLCVDRSRGGKFVVVPVDGLDVEDRAEDVLDLEDADRVNACLDSLPAREADVIRMNVVDNLSFVEISASCPYLSQRPNPGTSREWRSCVNCWSTIKCLSHG